MRTHAEQSAREGAFGGEAATRPPLGHEEPRVDEYRVGYDEYRVKLYKVACRAAREEREQLRLDWEQRNRERD